MKNLLILAVLLGLSSQCLAKAYFAPKKEMIENADAIVIVDITAVKKVNKNTESWDYRQKATAKVQQVLKGDATGTITLYGQESFICASCHYEPGRYLLFLRKNDDFYVGANWQNGIRPITDNNVEWYKQDDDRHTMIPLPLDKVVAEIHSVLNKPEPKRIKCKTGELNKIVAAPVTAHTIERLIFRCNHCKVDFKKCASCGQGANQHQKSNHIPVHKNCK